jgi:uncharacterized protein (TIGR02145 family)
MRNLALMWMVAGVAVALLAAGDGKPPVSTFTDSRDGKVYKIVKIGSQVWFAENLNYAAEGSVCYGEGGTVAMENGQFFSPPKILSPDEVQTNCAKYGRLYNWETALTACPAGTHLSTDKEWTTLVDYAGGEKKAGMKLKSSMGWESSKDVPTGTDEYGFSALPGGYSGNDSVFDYGDFYNVGEHGHWWSVSDDGVYRALNRNLYNNYEYVGKGSIYESDLFSVRCVLDDEKEMRK